LSSAILIKQLEEGNAVPALNLGSLSKTLQTVAMILLAAMCLSACSAIEIGSSSTSLPTSSLSYTQEQADVGKGEYTLHCGSCHGETLAGMVVVPAMAGEVFAFRWGGKPASHLMQHMRRMPPVQPGSLSDESYANIFGYVMQYNGVIAGEDSLPSDPEMLAELSIPLGNGLVADTQLASFGQSSLLDGLTPINARMLDNPSANDWLSWHRSNDSEGFSPLAQINKENVSTLKKVWSRELPPGNNNPTPLVHDGVMFFQTFPDTVMALDASSGELLWRYRHEPEVAPSRKMGVALYQDKVIVPTSDMRMLALDAKTGRLVWSSKIAADLEVATGMDRYDLRAAPTIAGNKIIQGVVGSLVSSGSFIFALDADTGEEAWRFNTIARPGEPGGNSWNDLPLEQRSGGSVWIPGSYDPDLGLIYFGVAPTYDVQPLLNLVEKKGVTNDALYTNATIALNVDTGKLIWHYQHLANDYWDLDWAFERQIMDIPVNGEMRKVVANVGKSGILEGLDAATGEYLFSVDSGVQNVVAAINPKTGKKTINPDTQPGNADSYLICPSAVGARSWPPAGYNPETYRLFIPLTEGCFQAGTEGGPFLMTGVNIIPAIFPASKDGKLGRLQAIDLKNQTLSWTYRQQTPLVSSLLATGGGLVFSGDLEPSIKAFDEDTGKVLWHQSLDDTPSAGLVSYGVGPTQYIVVVVGQSNNHVRDWTGVSDYYAKANEWDVEPRPAGKGASIVVFALSR
jgi:alcohol dehydrogenase (cytochrome c)